MTLRKKLIAEVAERCDYSKYEVEDVLLALEYVILQKLQHNEPIKIGELFTINSKDIAPRNYKDFDTGQIVKSTSKRKVEIKPSAYLLSKLNQED